MHEDQVLFLHIPKTAGTSLRAIVNDEYEGSLQLTLYEPSPYGPETLERLKSQAPAAKAFIGHVFFGTDEVLGFHARYVTFLRHPVSRVVSYFLHNKRHEDSPYFEHIRRGMTLRNMVEDEVIPEVNNNMTRMIAGLHDNSPLHSREILDRAIENMETRFMFVGLSESLDDGLRLLARQLGWRQGAEVPQLNQAPNDLREAIDETTWASIEGLNELDLELYEYGQQRFRRDLAAASSGGDQ